jgi:hypothetical protein
VAVGLLAVTGLFIGRSADLTQPAGPDFFSTDVEVSSTQQDAASAERAAREAQAVRTARAAAARTVIGFFAARDKASHHGDLTPFRATFTQNCGTCSQSERDIASATAHGQRQRGGDVRARITTLSGSAEQVRVTAVVTAGNATLVDGRGKVVRHYAGLPPSEWVFVVMPIQRRWLIVDAINLGSR